VANGRIAFGITAPGDANPDVYSSMPDGNALRRLTDDPGFDACPAYSADGRWITWCSSAGDPAGNFDIWVMKQNGKDKRRLTNLGGQATFPDFSPDGTKIAFTAHPAGQTTTNIYVVNTDGTDLKRLTTAALDQFPAWSPDGSKIVFESTRTGLKQVWVMDADGANQTQLTFDSTPKDQVPDWSPDGSRIAYVARTAAAGGDICVMNADGSDQHPITSGADMLGTAWSPDGTQIATLDLPSRTVEVMNANGTDVRAVQPGGIQFVPAWQARGVGADDEE
jgi:Tol biopolymer transport system component